MFLLKQNNLIMILACGRLCANVTVYLSVGWAQKLAQSRWPASSVSPFRNPEPCHHARVRGFQELNTVLKNDKRAIFTAASHAQKAVDFLHCLNPEYDGENWRFQKGAVGFSESPLRGGADARSLPVLANRGFPRIHRQVETAFAVVSRHPNSRSREPARHAAPPA